MLLRKMLRDMKANKTQFISIFLMAVLGVLVYSGINAEWYGMKKEVDQYYDKTNLPNIWIMSDNFTDGDLDNVRNISGISEAARRLTFDVTLNMKNDPTLRVNIIENNLLSSPMTVEGEDFDISKDGLWLDESFAKAHGLQKGNSIKIEFNGLKIEKNILGFIIHPEYVHNVSDDSILIPNHESFGFAFLSDKALPEGVMLPYNQLIIKTDGGLVDDGLMSELEEKFSDRYHVIINRDTHPSVSVFESEIVQNKAMGGVFPIVFFLIAALAMLTTMTRMTNNQRTQIGTLKALGFSQRKILLHYLSYGVWIGLVGGIIGLFIGPLLIPPILFNMQKTIYTLPNWSVAISPSSLLAVVIAVLCCGVSSYFACYGQLKEVPAATLRPKAPKVGRHTAFEKSKLWHKFGFSVQWNLRDTMRSRIRSIMAVVGVMGCSALLLFGLGLRDTVNGVSKWMYEDLNVYNSKVNLNEHIEKQELADLHKTYTGQLIQESQVQIRYGDKKESGALTVLDEGNEINFENVKKEKIYLPDEGIGISFKIAEILEVDMGDTIEWRIYGEKDWQKSTIIAIYRTPMGQGIAISKSAYEKMGKTFSPTSLLSSNKSINNNEKLNGVSSIQEKSQLIESFEGMLESMKMIIVILIAAAFILGSVVLYNLGALSFTERIRELATLKVLGFFSKQIRSLLLMQNVWLTVIGIIVGLPLGYVLLKFLLSTMSESTDMIAEVSVVSIAVSIVATFLLSVAVNLLLSRKIKSIDMVSSLKSVE